MWGYHIYRIKRKLDGTIDRYKARLVAKGFTQENGVDHKEKFNPVITATTIQTILALASMHNGLSSSLMSLMHSCMANWKRQSL